MIQVVRRDAPDQVSGSDLAAADGPIDASLGKTCDDLPQLLMLDGEDLQFASPRPSGLLHEPVRSGEIER